MAEQLVNERVFAAAEQINTEKSPTVATVREAAGGSNADAARFLKEWRTERDSAGSKIAATPATITELALGVAGTVWAEAVSTATAEHAIIEKAWRDERVHKDREVTELAGDLETATRTHDEIVRELRARLAQSNQSVRDSEASAAEAHDQLAVAERRHAEELSELKSQLAETRATVTTLQQTQNALIARIRPRQEGGAPQ